MRRLIVLLLATGVALVSVPSPPAMATFPGGNGEIVYERFLETSIAPRTILPDGTGDAPLANAPDDSFNFSASADGTHLAYVVRRSFWILDLATGDSTRVIRAKDLQHALFPNSSAFSPDGSQLVVCTFHRRKPHDRLFVVNVDGTGAGRISGDASMCSPDWSSTDRIVAANGGHRTRVFIMDPDGSDLVTTVTPPANGGQSLGGSPSWAPDGSSVIFIATADANRSDVWRVDADGSDLTRIIRTPRRWDWVPLYSPDGTKIAVSITDKKGLFAPEEIWVFDADGTNPVKITDSEADEYLQTWIPT
jgi:Tol biopolymer transport system component